MPEIRRTCNKCGSDHPIEFFNRHHRDSTGRVRQCKNCTRAAVENWRLANPLYQKRYDERPAQKLALRERLDRADRQYPERRSAREKLRNALKTGQIVRGTSCEVCGVSEVEAHHDDYSKPLDVRWFCKSHHRKRHHEMAKALAESVTN